MATSTPWGMSHSKTNYARGINFYSTASHGGIILSEGMNKRIPEYARNPNRAYEEDCDWAIVVTFLPGPFNADMRKGAKETLMNWNPDVYERYYGEEIPAGKSYIKDKKRKERELANRFVTTSAWGDWQGSVPTGMVGVKAVKRATGEMGHFLVTNAEYDSRDKLFGFVINEDVHSHWDAVKI